MSFPHPPLHLEGLRFKGDRDYLQGADILSITLHALSDGVSIDAIRDIDIVFHALARSGLTLCANAPSGSTPVAQLGCSIDGIRHKLLLVEDGRPVVERHPYPEDQIVAATIIDTAAATAASSAPLSFTNIERWIAMVKALHHAVYPDAHGKWLFARAKLAAYEDTYPERTEHCVSVKSDFGGKLTRSALLINGRELGEIFFALA